MADYYTAESLWDLIDHKVIDSSKLIMESF
jgi:hypothetical protein